MTPELIKKWAEEADQMADDQLQCPGEFHPDWHEVRDGLFAALVAAHEREQCALVCEQWNASHPERIAAAIRSRKDAS